MASDVVFKLDADQAKAVNAFLRVVDAQKKSERQFKKTTSAAKRQDRELGKTSATVGKLGKNLLALGGAGSLAAMIGRMSNGLDEMSAASGRLNREIRPLLSLGDNLKDIEVIRKQVLSGSTGLGRGSKEVTDAFFALQSGASNLSDTVRKELFASATDLAFLQSGDLAGSVNLVTKFYQNYGKEVASVTDLTDRLFAAADRGALTLDELAVLGPDVAAAANVMNVGLNELLATLIVTTQQLGKNEKTFTGVRNIILRMSNAEREGIDLTGKFTDKLQQLGEVDPDTLKRIFGDEAIGAVSVAAANAKAIADEVERLNNQAGILSGKLKDIVKDRAQLQSINLASAKQAATNATAGRGASDGGNFSLRKADIRTGLNNTGPGAFVDSLGLGGAYSTIAAGALSLDDYIQNNSPFSLSAVSPVFPVVRGGIKAFEDIGIDDRLDNQQRYFPEAAAQNYNNGIGGLGSVAPLEKFKSYNKDTGQIERGGSPSQPELPREDRPAFGDTDAFQDLIGKLGEAADKQLQAAKMMQDGARSRSTHAHRE